MGHDIFGDECVDNEIFLEDLDQTFDVCADAAVAPLRKKLTQNFLESQDATFINQTTGTAEAEVRNSRKSTPLTGDLLEEPDADFLVKNV